MSVSLVGETAVPGGNHRLTAGCYIRESGITRNSAVCVADPRGVSCSRGLAGGGSSGHGVVSRSGQGTEERPGAPGGGRTGMLPRKVVLAAGREPTFYIGGGNGVAL